MGLGDANNLNVPGMLVLALAAFWLLIAIVVAVLATRRLKQARTVLSAARTMAGLLASTPARPMVVKPSGTIEIDARLSRELGFDSTPSRLADLCRDDAGVVADDCARLQELVQTAALSGATIQCQVRLAGSGRMMEIRGAPAQAPEPAGTMLLWWFDTSSAEGERSKLELRLRQTEGALDALTHLIEAAPFPMWYRGPDLKLGLVNRAFVDAVEGSDAADVIARGSELVDAPGADSARSSAATALESGQPYERLQPATIRGERRMLRIVNVPLPTGAVAGFAIDVQELEDSRAEFSRHLQSQRDLADRMTAGTAQFDADRNLSFFNQPFAIMTQLDPEWLAEGPEFDRVLERMREQNRLPETRDFPAWRDDRRAWFSNADEVVEEEWMLAGGYAGKLQPPARDYVDAILESVTRLARLIDHVLDLTQAGGDTLDKEQVDLRELCRAAVETVRPTSEEKSQRFEASIADSTGSVVGDPRRLRESIEHVLGNAIAYTDPGGKISLKAEGDGSQAIITITDNGVGIADKELPQVFNRFHRIDEAGVRGEAALGLGLPLTRQFIEAHGGHVELKSKKGKGTTVTLTIPRAAP